MNSTLVTGGLYAVLTLAFAVISFVNPKRMRRLTRPAALILALLGGVAFFANWVEGRRENAGQTQHREQLAALEKKLADAQDRLRWMAKAQMPRIAALGDWENSPFTATLANKPNAEVEVIYPRDEQEPYWLSIAIADHLSKTGWHVTRLNPLTTADVIPIRKQAVEKPTVLSDSDLPPSEEPLPGADEDIPLWMRVGRHVTDINIVTSNGRLSPAAAALKVAIDKCGLPVAYTGNSNLRPDVVRVVVSSRL